MATGDDAGPAMVDLHGRVAAFMQANNIAPPNAYAPGQGVDEVTWKRVEQAANDALREVRLPAGADGAAIASSVVSEALAIGPITALLDDASVSRIVVNGATGIFATRGGNTQASPGRFSGANAVVAAAHRLLSAAGAAPAEEAAFASGTLADGTFVHAVMPSAGGPHLSIERPSAGRDLDGLKGDKVLSQNAATFLSSALAAGRTVVVGANHAGARSELIGALVGAGAADLRVVSVGTRIAGANVANVAGGADEDTQLREALKMGADRLVADCSAGGAFTALCGVSSTGGGVVGMAANSAEDAVRRLEHQACAASHGAREAAAAMVADAVDVVVSVLRGADGATTVAEVTDGSKQVFGTDGKASGHVPGWVADAQAQGHSIDNGIFR